MRSTGCRVVPAPYRLTQFIYKNETLVLLITALKYKRRSKQSSKTIITYLLTHDLSDGDGLSQSGGSTGSRHVVGSHTELQLVSGGEVSDNQ